MDIEAFILIGERSSRFGSDKSSATLGGETLLERINATVKAALPACPVTLVASSTYQSHNGLNNESGPVIVDLYPERGPLGGMQAALSHARARWALVLACDLPLVSADFLVYLTNNASEDTDVILPVQPDGRFQPLCALYKPDTCLALFETVLERHRPVPPLHRVLEQLRVRRIEFDEVRDLPNSQEIFTNINRTDDLQAASNLLAERQDKHT